MQTQIKAVDGNYLSLYCKIGIGPFVFITGLVLTLLVAIATVGYKSFAAAIVNPIRSLRYE